MTPDPVEIERNDPVVVRVRRALPPGVTGADGSWRP
jgi:hypothetical protein